MSLVDVFVVVVVVVVVIVVVLVGLESEPAFVTSEWDSEGGLLL